MGSLHAYKLPSPPPAPPRPAPPAGKVAKAVSGPGGAGMEAVVAFKYLECTKAGATAGCSRRFKDNNGVDNMG